MCVTLPDIIPYGILRYMYTMERRCEQYSVTNCRNVGAMFPPSISMCRFSKIDVGDRCVDLQKSMVDVSTFEDRCVDL